MRSTLADFRTSDSKTAHANRRQPSVHMRTHLGHWRAHRWLAPPSRTIGTQRRRRPELAHPRACHSAHRTRNAPWSDGDGSRVHAASDVTDVTDSWEPLQKALISPRTHGRKRPSVVQGPHGALRASSVSGCPDVSDSKNFQLCKRGAADRHHGHTPHTPHTATREISQVTSLTNRKGRQGRPQRDEEGARRHYVILQPNDNTLVIHGNTS